MISAPRAGAQPTRWIMRFASFLGLGAAVLIAAACSKDQEPLADAHAQIPQLPTGVVREGLTLGPLNPVADEADSGGWRFASAAGTSWVGIAGRCKAVGASRARYLDVNFVGGS